MFFKKKKPNRLYIPTKSRWYRRPKRDTTHLNTRKIFSHNIRTHISRVVKDAFLYIAAAVVLVSLMIFIFFSSKFSVNEIEIARGNFHIDNAAVSDLLKVYRGKSIFFFSKSEASQLIRDTYPEFSKITIRKLLPDKIKVELETYEIVANMKASYILPKAEKIEGMKPASEEDSLEEEGDSKVEKPSGEESEAETELNASEETTVIREEITPIEQKGLLNEIGQAIFGQEENLELMTITLENLSQPIEDRQFAIPTADMKYIMDSVRYFTNLLNVEITAISYLPIAHEVHLTTEKNLTMWLNTDMDYKVQIEKLNTVYKYKIPEFDLDKEDIAYVDLRVNEKVIYCPRGAPCDK